MSSIRKIVQDLVTSQVAQFARRHICSWIACDRAKGSNTSNMALAYQSMRMHRSQAKQQTATHSHTQARSRISGQPSRSIIA